MLKFFRMKKYILFLSFIIVSMSCMPCSDIFAMGKMSNIPSTEKSVSTHSKSDQTSDLCSPFCVCSCCNTTSEVLLINSLVIISTSVSTEFDEAYKGEVISLPLSVWQPPKLS